MKWGNSATRWGLASRLFHWFMAIAILFMFCLGITMINMRLSPEKLEMFMVHKSTGMLLLLAIILRILWRIINPPPKFPKFISHNQQQIIRLGQLLMYFLMFCIPVSGWVINSAANFPLHWFGLFQVPAITDPSIAVEEIAKIVHFTLICILGVLIIGHIAAALHHHFVLKNDVLRRML